MSPGARVLNCIFWGNSDGGDADESAQVQGVGGEFSHCFVQGWTGGLGGEDNSGEDPLLGGPGGYHLSPGSPAMDAGLGDSPAYPGETDIDGEPRVAGARVDVGADEYLESLRKAFLRGDADCDGEVDIADPIRMLFHLFVGGHPLFCERSADSNEDARVDIGDPICVLQALFTGSGPLAGRPWQCEEDPADGSLSCAWYPACK
jgi:hypothetical protein